MIRRAILYAAALPCTALCLPSSAAASTGTSGGSAVGSASGPEQTNQVTAQSGDANVSATGNGMSISSLASAILRRGLSVTGSLPASDAGRSVAIEISGAKTQWVWQRVATAQVQANGGFSAVWQTNHIGRFAVRALVASGGATTASAGGPTVSVTVYRPSLATLYGPGFYGQRTACGVRLRRTTIGVANRTLPCGTPVAIYYNGRTLIVPVIDRGPYAHGADWDLTMATGKALGISGTGMLGATSLPFSR